MTNYFIKFKPSTTVWDKLMPVNALTKQEATDIARKFYHKSVDTIISRNENIYGFTTIPFGSTVHYVELDLETSNPKQTIVYPIHKENTDPIMSIINWFKVANPEPDNKSIAVQIGCHIEEFREMLKSLEWIDEEKINKAYTNLVEIETLFKSLGSSPKEVFFNTMNQSQKVELLDSLADQVVTATGIAYRMNFKFYDAIQEVSNSNWSKFENNIPVRDANGKILKGKNYFKPDLVKFV